MDFLIDKVSLNGFSMEYLKFGNGRKNLVILPGLSVQSVLLYSSSVVKQYERFTKDFTVYLFDRRINLPQEYSVSDMADDTAQAVKYLGLKNIYLFGASQGGMIAMDIAIKNVGLVEKLVLASTAMHMDEKSVSIVDDWIKLAENHDKENLFLSFGERIYPEKLFGRFKDVFRDMSEKITDTDLKRFVIMANGGRDFNVLDRAYKIKCPVMVISDSDDKIFGIEPVSEMEERFKLNEGFEMKRYSGFGHAVYDTSPDFKEKMYNFLKK